MALRDLYEGAREKVSQFVGDSVLNSVINTAGSSAKSIVEKVLSRVASLGEKFPLISNLINSKLQSVHFSGNENVTAEDLKKILGLASEVEDALMDQDIDLDSLMTATSAIFEV